MGVNIIYLFYYINTRRQKYTLILLVNVRVIEKKKTVFESFDFKLLVLKSNDKPLQKSQLLVL